MHAITPEVVAQVQRAIRSQRLLETALELISIPSPTRSAAAVAERFAAILSRDGFSVERPVAGWEPAPAVVARYDSGRPGKTIQFNGHLDTVHLAFVPPRVEQGVLYGSGSSDMKGGIAAVLEAARALRDANLLPGGQVLITAHDLHESPWGDGSQVDRLIDAGYVGDGVLLPEYCREILPVVGRGLVIFEITIRREGEPVHEVRGGIEQPSVIAAGAELVQQLGRLDRELSVKTHPLGGRESAFVGQVASGEIYNQAPVEFRLSGTRRWLPGTNYAEVERGLLRLCEEVAHSSQTTIIPRLTKVREACELDPDGPDGPLIRAFDAAHSAVSGAPLPRGAKPFVDDGNSFIARGRVPAITHGPDARGAHTLHESVPVAELERVALVYALTAIAFCGG